MATETLTSADSPSHGAARIMLLCLRGGMARQISSLPDQYSFRPDPRLLTPSEAAHRLETLPKPTYIKPEVAREGLTIITSVKPTYSFLTEFPDIEATHRASFYDFLQRRELDEHKTIVLCVGGDKALLLPAAHVSRWFQDYVPDFGVGRRLEPKDVTLRVDFERGADVRLTFTDPTSVTPTAA